MLCSAGVVILGTLVLTLVLEGKAFNLSTLRILVVGCLYDLYYAEVCFFYIQFVESVEFCQMLFCNCLNDRMFFVFRSVTVIYHIR